MSRITTSKREILDALTSGTKTTKELSEQLGRTINSINKTLAILRNDKLIKSGYYGHQIELTIEQKFEQLSEKLERANKDNRIHRTLISALLELNIIEANNDKFNDDFMRYRITDNCLSRMYSRAPEPLPTKKEPEPLPEPEPFDVTKSLEEFKAQIFRSGKPVLENAYPTMAESLNLKK